MTHCYAPKTLPVCLSTSLTTRLSASLSVCLFACLSVYCTCLSLSVPIFLLYLSVCLSVCLFISASLATCVSLNTCSTWTVNRLLSFRSVSLSTVTPVAGQLAELAPHASKLVTLLGKLFLTATWPTCLVSTFRRSSQLAPPVWTTRLTTLVNSPCLVNSPHLSDQLAEPSQQTRPRAINCTRGKASTTTTPPPSPLHT